MADAHPDPRDDEPRAGGQGDDDHGRTADAPQEIPAQGWRDVLTRVRFKAQSDQVPLLSAGVAFYGLLSLIPAMIAAVTIYGLFADPSDVRRQVEDLAEGLPSSAQDLLVDQLRSIVDSSSAGLSIAAVLAVAVALWSASTGVRQLVAALDLAYDEEETRGFVRVRLLGLALTAGALVGAAVAIGAIAILPGLLARTGLGDAAQLLINVLRWPLLAVLFAAALAVLYRVGPDRDDPQLQWVSWGAGLATVLWLIGSGLFALYANQFASFNETYGSLAGVVVMMLWLQLTAAVVLLGAELNAELERQTLRDSTVERAEPMGHREARAADTLGASADQAKEREGADVTSE